MSSSSFSSSSSCSSSSLSSSGLLLQWATSSPMLVQASFFPGSAELSLTWQSWRTEILQTTMNIWGQSTRSSPDDVEIRPLYLVLLLTGSQGTGHPSEDFPHCWRTAPDRVNYFPPVAGGVERNIALPLGLVWCCQTRLLTEGKLKSSLSSM